MLPPTTDAPRAPRSPGHDAEALGRRLLPHDDPRLAAVLRRRPWRVVVDTAVNYAVIALAFALLARVPAWWSAVVAFLVIGNRQYALSVLTHDGDHRTLFARRRVNDAFTQAALCAPVGVDFEGERRNHGMHHRHLALPTDPDRYLYATDDKSTRARFVMFLTGLTMFPRTLKKALHGRQAASVPWSVAARGFVARRGATLAAQVVIFAAICARFPAWYYLVFWLGPVYPMVFVPHKVRMFCEHALPVTPDAAADARRLITYSPGPIEQLLVSPYNLHLHAEHHVWPYVPYYHLGALRPLLADRPEVTVRRGYLGFLVEYFRKLPLAAEG